MLQLRRSVF